MSHEAARNVNSRLCVTSNCEKQTIPIFRRKHGCVNSSLNATVILMRFMRPDHWMRTLKASIYGLNTSGTSLLTEPFKSVKVSS